MKKICSHWYQNMPHCLPSELFVSSAYQHNTIHWSHGQVSSLVTRTQTPAVSFGNKFLVSLIMICMTYRTSWSSLAHFKTYRITYQLCTIYVYKCLHGLVLCQTDSIDNSNSSLPIMVRWICFSIGLKHTEQVQAFVLLAPSGTVCLIHLKTLLCHYRVFRITFKELSSLSTDTFSVQSSLGIDTLYTVFTARCTLVQSAVLRSHVVCLSVCPSVRPSVTLVNCDHIGWNSSKIISPLVSLGCSLFATPTW